MVSWAVRPFKFHWQNFTDECLRVGFASISHQRESKFPRQRNKNIAIFAILGSLVNNHRKVVVFSVSMQLQKFEHY